MKIVIFLFVASILSLSFAFAQTVKDIDGNMYKLITINKLEWMTSNLSVKRFKNGEKIMHAQTEQEWYYAYQNEISAWCYYEDENGVDTKTILYNWYAVVDKRGLAPTGTHIPTVFEWTGFVNSLGGANATPRKIMAKSGWETYQHFEEHTANIFNAKPVGSRYVSLSPMSHWIDGKSKGKYTNFWTSTSLNQDLNPNYAYRIGLAYNYPAVINELESGIVGKLNEKGNGYSVRCVVDVIP